MFTKAHENEEGGIQVNNLRYAEDTALLAENKSDLQNMLNIVENMVSEHSTLRRPNT